MNINDLVAESLMYELNTFEKKAFGGHLSSSATYRGFKEKAGRSYGRLTYGTSHGTANLAHSGKSYDEISNITKHQANKSIGADKMNWKQKLNPIRNYKSGKAAFNSTYGRDIMP